MSYVKFTKTIYGNLKKISLCVLFLSTLFVPFFLSAGETTKEFVETWPEVYAEGVLIINGDDGEEVDRTTVCTIAGTRYPIVGNFEYDLTGFSESGNVLTFTQSTPVARRLTFIGAITAKGDVTGTYVHFSVFLNGSEIFPKSITGVFMKTANQAQGLPGFAFSVMMEEDYTLEIRTWSDSSGESVTITHFNYVVFPAYKQKSS